MVSVKAKTRELAQAYDQEAEATGWFGPEVAFGLIYKYVQSGQSILDMGIGTGLGSDLFRKAGLVVYGMDISQEMLDVCRTKGFRHLTQHDLCAPPYPFASESLDHAVCVGVLGFISDLSPIFLETARILYPGGKFVFVTGDRAEDETMAVVVGEEYTKMGKPITLYRHSGQQVGRYIQRVGFTLLRSLGFTVYMDGEKTKAMKAKAYLAKKSA